MIMVRAQPQQVDDSGTHGPSTSSLFLGEQPANRRSGDHRTATALGDMHACGRDARGGVGVMI